MRVGLDIGSTTIKCVVLDDEENIIYSSYERHYSHILHIPHRDMLPVSLEEQIICFADKFFSKTHLDREKSVEKARKSIAKHGEEGLARFDKWCELFL